MAFSGRRGSNQDSQVLHETLNVIDEHITDLRSPSGSNGGLLHVAADSGSEYSSQLDHRMSYIHGEETDEEEDDLHTRSEVESWNPDDVAEYLFTTGVEKHHCEVFRDQEISGEVLLGMDQASLFIKAFDLGPVGRRLKTWQKIKALQDEVNDQVRPTTSHTRRSTQTYGSDIGSDDARRSTRSRTNTITSSSNGPVFQQQQRLPPIDDRPLSIHSRRLSLNQTPRMDPTRPLSPVALKSSHGLPSDGSAAGRAAHHEKRPSAASVRDLHHSRRHSSADYRLPSTSSGPQRTSNNGNYPEPDASAPQHKKQPSFDRNWTLGSASASTSQSQGQRLRRESTHLRPMSSASVRDALTSPEHDMRLDMGGLLGGLGESAIDFERGYFSGPDTENRRKSFLQKKQRESVLKFARSPPSTTGNSYAEEQRVRSATALSRHSHFGSVDSVRDSTISPAAQKYYGVIANGASNPHRRTSSNNTTDSSHMRPILPPKDTPAPTVTRLDTTVNKSSASFDKARPSPASPVSPASNRNGEWFSVKPGFKTPGFGLRALSDAVSGHDRSKMASPISHTDSFPKDSPMQSPSRTESSTPSVGPSFELDSPDAKSPSTTGTGMSARSAARRKGKKETSAYQRGLLKISPREAMMDADYSGWMKKKSSNLMATWKPRLFVLKGRRLAYYYSEDDQEEKGLIDISFHRVLPADNERLTGLHATITGASASPAVPANSSVPTLAAAEAGAESEMSLKAATSPSSESIFIFKLTPPRAGLSRAVNFTKPMVHYFAVPNVAQGRLWMAALVKATIDRDDTVPITTTYQQKTISLTKAREMRHRPPALMNLDEKLRANQGLMPGGDKAGRDDDDYDDGNILDDDEKRMLVAALSTSGARKASDKTANGLGITYDEKDSGVSAVSSAPSADRLGVKTPYKAESARSRQFVFEPEKGDDQFP